MLDQESVLCPLKDPRYDCNLWLTRNRFENEPDAKLYFVGMSADYAAVMFFYIRWKAGKAKKTHLKSYQGREGSQLINWNKPGK